VSDWLRRVERWTTRLHYVELLTEAEVLAALRDGADVHAGDGQAGAPTPLSIARAQLVEHPEHASAALVAAAAGPWSRETHRLFPVGARARAVDLLIVGHLVAARFACGEEEACVDVWLDRVLPFAIER